MKRKASATQINLYRSCKMRWFLKYVRKMKEPVTTALVKGSLVHSTIETMSKTFNPRKNTEVNASNYKTAWFTYIYGVFEEELTKPQIVFGKVQPSYEEQLREICGDDSIKTGLEIADAKQCITNFMVVYVMQFTEQLKSVKGGFSQAYYMLRPKFSEFEIQDEEFMGWMDEVFEKDGKIIINDIKSGGSYYKSGYSEEYRIQLSLYCYFYYKSTGVLPAYGSIKFVKLGRECLYPFSMDTIKEMEEVLADFKHGTQSVDITDYPPNLDYKFCCSRYASHKSSRGKPWCAFAGFCDEHIEKSGLVPLGDSDDDN